MSSQGNKHLLKMGGIKFLESSVSLVIQNFHQLSPLFDGCQGELYHQALWKENWANMKVVCCVYVSACG